MEIVAPSSFNLVFICIHSLYVVRMNTLLGHQPEVSFSTSAAIILTNPRCRLATMWTTNKKNLLFIVQALVKITIALQVWVVSFVMRIIIIDIEPFCPHFDHQIMLKFMMTVTGLHSRNLGLSMFSRIFTRISWNNNKRVKRNVIL